jgi:hypothetical protein
MVVSNGCMPGAITSKVALMVWKKIGPIGSSSE